MANPVDLLLLAASPLPASVELVGLEGEEEISRVFSYRLHIRSGTALLDPDKLLYQPVSVTVAPDTAHERLVNGLIAEITQEPANSAKLWDYRVVIVPKLAFLDQTRDCRFFESLSPLDIVEKILGEFGIIDVAKRVSEPPPKRAYTVMFNETYLGFIERLLASEGIFYFFEFTGGVDTLVLGDSNAAFKAIAHSPVAFGSQGGILSGMDFWHRHDATAAGRIETGDYNPESSTARINGAEPTILKAAGTSARAHYRWPAGAPDAAAAGGIAKRRMLAAEARAALFRGEGSLPDLHAGARFTLDPDPMTGEASDYVALRVAMTVSDAGRAASQGGRSGISVSCTGFPAATPWRPARLPKPEMPGLFTAIVIGPDGQDIHTDDLGRIKVRFPWDHRQETTESGTLWVRVIQPWAGSGWGAQFIPRIGMEVAIAFLEGDIDRPVAVGALYNSANMPVFPAAKKTISGFRTRSTLQGGSEDYSELSFDDTKGSELLRLHAEKDYKAEVEHDQTLTVGHNRAVKVDQDETVDITGSQTVTVQGAISHSSQQSITLKVGANSIKIDNEGITLNGLKISVSGTMSVEATAPMTKVTGEGLLTLKGGLVQIN